MICYLKFQSAVLKETIDDLEWPGSSIQIRIQPDPPTVILKGEGHGDLQVCYRLACYVLLASSCAYNSLHLQNLADWVPLLCKYRPSNRVPMRSWSVIQVNFLCLESQMVCFFVLICRPYCFLQGINTSFFEQLPRTSPVVSSRIIVGQKPPLGGEGCWKSSTWFHLPGQVCHTSVILVEEPSRQAESPI